MARLAMPGASFPPMDPSLQISFHYRLRRIRELYLNDALSAAVKSLDLKDIDAELNRLVKPTDLKHVASFGVRGELAFPVPPVIRSRPFLLGYYRLMYGMSQKEFFQKGPFGRFKVLEEDGAIPDRLDALIEPLCKSLCVTGGRLVRSLGAFSGDIVRDLQLLTIGPQLRGSENNRIGQRATQQVQRLIRDIVQANIEDETQRTMMVRNASSRMVLIAFFADPDVEITENLGTGSRPTLAIEIKGGSDESNVHNRPGEAEKSHQKAKSRGFVECWTILRSRVDEATAKKESPTTNRFYRLDEIRDSRHPAHTEFKSRLASLVGIRAAPAPKRAKRT